MKMWLYISNGILLSCKKKEKKKKEQNNSSYSDMDEPRDCRTE